MVRLKHRPISQFPSVDTLKDEFVKQFGEDLGDIILKSFRDIYDDLISLQINIVDSLPTTVDQESRSKLYLRRGTGGTADELFMIVNTGGAAYGFKQIALT